MSFEALKLSSARIPPVPKWPKGAEVRTHFGMQVLWHDSREGGRYYSPQDLEPYRQIGDPEVDEIFELLDKENTPVKSGDDLLEMARIAASSSSSSRSTSTTMMEPQTTARSEKALAAFYRHYSQIPSWVDAKQIARGQKVFLAYSAAISISLFYRSLVPGFSIPKIAAVLYSTGYLAPPATTEHVQGRLMDTGAMIAACVKDIQSIYPNGQGWKAALQVRFLHAKVRRALLRRRAKNNNSSSSRVWDTDRFGVPINQEDMAATLLAFSINSLVGCEIVLGFPLPATEQLDYLAFWRYIGWLLGVPVEDDNYSTDNRLKPLDPCGPGWIPSDPDPIAHSRATLISIIFHTLSPDESSVRVAHHLLRIGRKRHEKNKAGDDGENWFYFRSLQCRRFCGHPLADALQLPYHPSWYRRILIWTLSTMYLWILRVYTICALPWSPFRRRLVDLHGHYTSKFLTEWVQSHPERLKKTSQQFGSKQNQQESLCPFAMVAPPNN